MCLAFVSFFFSFIIPKEKACAMECLVNLEGMAEEEEGVLPLNGCVDRYF